MLQGVQNGYHSKIKSREKEKKRVGVTLEVTKQKKLEQEDKPQKHCYVGKNASIKSGFFLLLPSFFFSAKFTGWSGRGFAISDWVSVPFFVKDHHLWCIIAVYCPDSLAGSKLPGENFIKCRSTVMGMRHRGTGRRIYATCKKHCELRVYLIRLPREYRRRHLN